MVIVILEYEFIVVYKPNKTRGSGCFIYITK
jgi:hypothetical protein